MKEGRIRSLLKGGDFTAEWCVGGVLVVHVYRG